MFTQTNVEAPGEQVAEQPQTAKKKRRVRRPTEQLGLVTLPVLAEVLGLPLKWLRREVSAGRLPTTPVGGRLLFDPQRVARVVRDRAMSDNQYGRPARSVR
jgi:hypothetical protein